MNDLQVQYHLDSRIELHRAEVKAEIENDWRSVIVMRDAYAHEMRMRGIPDYQPDWQ